LFWTKLKSSGKISPYIKIGIGAEKNEFRESYNYKPEFGFTVEEWFFCYGLGGGIDLNIFYRLIFQSMLMLLQRKMDLLLNYHNYVVKL